MDAAKAETDKRAKLTVYKETPEKKNTKKYKKATNTKAYIVNSLTDYFMLLLNPSNFS